MARPKSKGLELKTNNPIYNENNGKYEMQLDKKPKPNDYVIIKTDGIGNTIEKVLESTGVKKVFEIFVDGKDCGCEQRKEKLNNLFPYRFKARCLTELEYNDYKEFKEHRTLKMEWEQVTFVCDLYASVFNRQKWYPCVGCSPKILIGMIDKLDKVYDAYEKN